jgi:hypothetical protein
MAEYKALEKAAYQQVRDSPFTRVQGLPTWLQKQNLVKEMQAAGVDATVSYEWAGDHGLLAEIDGAEKYLADTGELYVAPERPPQNHAGVLTGNPTNTQVRVRTAINDLLKQDYATLLGFRKGVGHNVRDALDKKYWEQLEVPVFLYKTVKPRDYITNLDKWVRLDERQIKDLRKHFERGWEADEHITAFALRLNKEQKQLLEQAKVTITEVDKNLHYMLEIWESGKYDKEVMMEWTARPSEMKAYEHSVPFFEAKELEIEKFEAASGSSKKNGFATAHAVMNDKTHELLALIVQKDAEREEREVQIQKEMQEFRTAILNISEQRGSRRSTRRKPKPAPIAESDSESESESETESEEEPTPPPTPIKKERRKRKKKPKPPAKKAKKAKAKKPFKEGDKYKAGMDWDQAWPKETKWAFKKARFEWQKANPVEGKKDRLKSMREMIAREEARVV